MVTVPSIGLVEADSTMKGTRGSISGVATGADTSAPLPGAFAIESNPATGAPQTGAVADAAGRFTLPDLRLGGHVLAAIDPTGAHGPRYHPDAPAPVGATPVTVTSGATATADVTLPATPAVGAGSNNLTGTVTDSSTTKAIAGAMVFALRAADFGLARGGVTSATGTYSLTVPDGSYALIFLDPTGRHAMEWHANRPYYEIANATPVMAPATTNAALDPTTGQLIGTVKDPVSSNPVSGAWVVAIGPTGIEAGAITSNLGDYSISGLPAGAYRAVVVDPSALRRSEYWPDAATYDGATAFAITGGGTTRIDVSLERP